jgi:hypothetical protein
MFLVASAACGASPHPRQTVAVDARPGHYHNRIYKLGAVIEVADNDHPVIKLDGDDAAERLERRGAGFVDREGRTILQPVDDRSVVVYVHGGGVGVEMGRDD